MICPTCRQSGLRSTVRITATHEARKGDRDYIEKDHFFDEDGLEHAHNPNIVTTSYRCSNGHRFAERSSWKCFCGYMACPQEIVGVSTLPVKQEPPVVGHTADGTPVMGMRRAPAGSVTISGEQRRAINERKGKP